VNISEHLHSFIASRSCDCSGMSKNKSRSDLPRDTDSEKQDVFVMEVCMGHRNTALNGPPGLLNPLSHLHGQPHKSCSL